MDVIWVSFRSETWWVNLFDTIVLIENNVKPFSVYGYFWDANERFICLILVSMSLINFIKYIRIGLSYECSWDPWMSMFDCLFVKKETLWTPSYHLARIPLIPEWICLTPIVSYFPLKRISGETHSLVSLLSLFINLKWKES